MNEFFPEENTMVCVYGPPEYFDAPTSDNNYGSDEPEKDSFLTWLSGLFRKLLDFLKGLFS